jgi:hypothetical protein
MHEAAQAFARALEAERDAARHADFDALLRIQDEKLALMPLIKETATPEVARELAELARKNIGLMRHLLACVRGHLGLDAEPTYTARGEALTSGHNALRGRL